MSELDAQGWHCQSREQVQNVRSIAPFNVTECSPKIWYTRPGHIPFPDYLLMLLNGAALGVTKIFHFQCKSYYACLRKIPDVLPHQTAQYYKASMRRKEQGVHHQVGGVACAADSDAMELDQGQHGPAQSAGKTRGRGQARGRGSGVGRGRRRKAQAGVDGDGSMAAVSDTLAAAEEPEMHGSILVESDDEAMSIDSSSTSQSEGDSEFEVPVDALPEEHQPDHDLGVAVPEPPTSHEGAELSPEPSELDLVHHGHGPAVSINEVEILDVSDTDGEEAMLGGPASSSSGCPGRPPPQVPDHDSEVPGGFAADAVGPDAPAGVAAADAGDDAACEHGPVQVPVEFEPVVRTEGHQKICKVLLPVLLQVLRDPFWRSKPQRDQVREACDRPWTFNRAVTSQLATVLL